MSKLPELTKMQRAKDLKLFRQVVARLDTPYYHQWRPDTSRWLVEDLLDLIYTEQAQ